MLGKGARDIIFVPGLMSHLELLFGAIAAGQRHYYSTSSANCAGAGTIAITVLAGPLNYIGANPKLSCH